MMEMMTNPFSHTSVKSCKKQNLCLTEIERELNYNQNI